MAAAALYGEWPPPFLWGPPAGGFSPALRRGRLSAASFFALFLFDLRHVLAAVARHPGMVASRRGAGGERGKPLYTPYDPRTPLARVAAGVTVACRVPCLPLAAGGKSARIFPRCGRYARLLRRSRVAGIVSAPRLAGLMGFFSAFALKGGERRLLFVMQRSDRGQACFSRWSFAAVQQ